MQRGYASARMSLPGRIARLSALTLGPLLACSSIMAATPLPVAARAVSRLSASDADGDGLTNVFERRSSHTDPRRVDTNGNGVADGQEDPDHDGLTNLWEQRLGLNPLRRDSDGNGVPDGREDFDHDHLSNVFEIRGKVSDPRTNDSNGDGVRDSAEDPDGDLLSNLGEQRWHTAPEKADSNGNGVPDGAEDANRNGLSNSAEQDARHVPHTLTPSLIGALVDLAAPYFDGCHVTNREVVFRHCNYGNPTAAIRVALYGDSHAVQWFPAVEAIASARGWRLDLYTRSACPSADVKTLNLALGVMDTYCAAFRAQALQAMAADPPTIVIVTSRVGYQLYDASDQPIAPAGYESAWDAGLARTLRALPATSIKLVLEDTPFPYSVDVAQCLGQHPDSIAACEGTRAAWIHTGHALAESATALAKGGVFGSLNDEVCPYDPCGVVFDELLAYRDTSHLTATFVQSLAPSMGALLDSVLAP